MCLRDHRGENDNQRYQRHISADGCGGADEQSGKWPHWDNRVPGVCQQIGQSQDVDEQTCERADIAVTRDTPRPSSENRRNRQQRREIDCERAEMESVIWYGRQDDVSGRKQVEEQWPRMIPAVLVRNAPSSC